MKIKEKIILFKHLFILLEYHYYSSLNFYRKKKSFQSNKTLDFKYKYTIKDIFFIGLINLLVLIHCFGNILILERTKEVILSNFYSLDYLFTFIISIFYFKNTHYKHQYISLSIIIILAIIRNLIKLGQYEFFSFNIKDIIIESFLILLKSSTNSLYNAFFKILIEKYYFSIFKILCLFGFINAVIFLILIFVFAYIPYEENFLYSVEYDNKYYFENCFFNNHSTFEIIQIVVYYLLIGNSNIFINKY